MSDIVSVFQTQTRFTNDNFIFKYMISAFPHCVENRCVYNQSCTPLEIKYAI